MISIERTKSGNTHFRELVSLLDKDLTNRYGNIQNKFNQHNLVENIETVVIAYLNNFTAGCGCFRCYDENTIEIKRMFVKPEFRRKGISKLILKELEKWGKEKGFLKAILETGDHQTEAIGLYEKYGYQRIKNYGPYVNIPQSICMQKYL